MYKSKRIDSTVLYKGKIIEVSCDNVLLENNSIAKREIVHHNGGCCILVLDDKQNVFFVEQYRYAVGQTLIELPAGKIDLGEDHYQTAIREAQEEIGVKPNKMKYMGFIFPTCGYSTEKIHMYFCNDFSYNKLSLDDDEFLSTIKIPFSKAIDMVFNGEIKDAKTIVCLLKSWELIKNEHK